MTVEFLSDQWVEVGNDTVWDEKLGRPVGKDLRWIVQGTRIRCRPFEQDGETWVDVPTPSAEDVETCFPVRDGVCRIVEDDWKHSDEEPFIEEGEQ